MQKIMPCLWYDSQAEQAANFYCSIFKNSKIHHVARYGAEAAKMSGQPVGSVLTVTFQLEGQEFMGLNGGPIFKFTPAISFVTNCETQDEIDSLWSRLLDGGQESQCGWLTDKFGVSWQIVPAMLGKLLSLGEATKSGAMMQALLPMRKLDINALQDAYERG
ncbi:MAG: VOC family protein [Pirellulales bacterium]|nr:VOC family protein [Pirellulales bacterium]